MTYRPLNVEQTREPSSANRIAWQLIAIAIGMTCVMGFLMQTRVASPFLDNFTTADAQGWKSQIKEYRIAEDLAQVALEDGTSTQNQTKKTAYSSFLWSLEMAQTNTIIFLYEDVSVYTFPLLGLACATLSCWLLVHCGSTLSPKAGWLFGSVIALNPMFWIYPLGIYKEPYLTLIGALVLTAAMMPAMRTINRQWILILAFIISMLSIPLRLEVALSMYFVLALILLARKWSLESCAVYIPFALSLLIITAAIINLPSLLGYRAEFYSPDFYMRHSPASDSGLSYHTYLIASQLYENGITRPLGMLFNGLRITLNPWCRPMGLGDQGILILEFGRWISKLLCSMAVICALLHVVRWKQTNSWSKWLVGMVALMLAFTVAYPILVDRYFYPIMIFGIPLLLGLPRIWAYRTIACLAITLVCSPIALLAFGITPPVVRGYPVVPEQGNPFLPGYATSTGSNHANQPVIENLDAD